MITEERLDNSNIADSDNEDNDAECLELLAWLADSTPNHPRLVERLRKSKRVQRTKNKKGWKR
jgi:hypothetical protein